MRRWLTPVLRPTKQGTNLNWQRWTRQRCQFQVWSIWLYVVVRVNTVLSSSKLYRYLFSKHLRIYPDVHTTHVWEIIRPPASGDQPCRHAWCSAADDGPGGDLTKGMLFGKWQGQQLDITGGCCLNDFDWGILDTIWIQLPRSFMIGECWWESDARGWFCNLITYSGGFPHGNAPDCSTWYAAAGLSIGDGLGP